MENPRRKNAGELIEGFLLSSKEKQKKEKELKTFELFRGLYGNFPDGEYCQKKSHPDFIIDCSEYRLGIELTEIYTSDKFQEHWANQNKAITKAIKEIEKQNVKPLWVIVFFDYDYDIDTTALANQLVEIIVEHYPADDKPIKITDPNWPFAINSINLQRGASEHRWKAAQYGWGTRSIEALKKRIESKDKKYRNYLGKCDKCWLLISYDKITPSQMFHFSKEELKNEKFETFFEKIFLMETKIANITLHELIIQPKNEINSPLGR